MVTHTGVCPYERQHRTGHSKLEVIILLGVAALTNTGWEMFSKPDLKRKKVRVTCPGNVLLIAGRGGENGG